MRPSPIWTSWFRHKRALRPRPPDPLLVQPPGPMMKLPLLPPQIPPQKPPRTQLCLLPVREKAPAVSPQRRQAPREGPGKPRPIRAGEEPEGDKRSSQSEQRGAMEDVTVENPTQSPGPGRRTLGK